MHRTRTGRPARASTALLVLASSAVLGLQRPALAEPVTEDPLPAAAGWLVSQLVDGNHIETVVDLNGDGQITDDERFPDYGLTADTILALAAAGVGGDASAAATDYLAANVELYVGDADVDDDGVDDANGEYYAGALAKTLLVADVTGRDGADFGGVDLISRLLFTETPEGRFSDVSQYGDFSNNISESLAIIALARTSPIPLTEESKRFVHDQRCTDGGPQDGNVPLTIDADPCLPASISIDTTSYGLQVFRTLDDGPAVRPTTDFLLRSQGEDGGFSDQGVVNANSTGLAALAIGPYDRVISAYQAAVQWLIDRQLGCSAPPEQQGAIAYTDGPDGTPLYDDRATRATAQAMLGIGGIALSDLDAAGSAPAAPRLDCAEPTPTPTDPGPSATPTPSTPGPTTATTTSRPGLPNTGTDLTPLLGFGGGLLLVGTGLLVAARRRTGLHQ